MKGRVAGDLQAELSLALLLPGLIASEFPPTHTLPASLTLTSTRPARRGSSLTHWLPRGAAPFRFCSLGTGARPFQTIIPPCPCALRAELRPPS